MTNAMRRKIWNLIRGGSFHGYLRTASGYPLTLTGCMPEYPVLLSVSGNTVQDGTPSPDNPVEACGVGEKTADSYVVPVQLDKPTEVTAVLTPQIGQSGVQLSVNGGTTPTGAESLSLSKPIRVKPGYSYSTSDNCRFRFYKGYISSSNALGTIKGDIVTNAIAPEDAVYAYISFETAKYGEFTVVERGTVHEYKTLNLYTDAPLYGDGDVSDTVKLDVANKKATLTQRISVSDIGEITQLATPVTADISSMQDWDSIPKLWRGTAVITADTTVSPSEITAKYYADNPEVN